ncbi:hypothetical protein [Pseudomonas tohonis]|uniref:hypothetical protein n=1 Tax=Pseudomonas tohonis TaxID=2725477 RepID=UPI001F1BA434|nr:hypothetical protein [Pseudomonas tohonis]GJN45399.1 hypothetical protein TUM20249_13850 [Pseudomonas tohonis]
MNIKIFIIPLALILASCTSQNQVTQAYAPSCPASTKGNDINTVMVLLECNQKQEAKSVARRASLQGNIELNKIFLQLLENDNETDYGLTSALKSAESGDPTATIATIHIAEKYQLNSLNETLFELVKKTSNTEHPYPVLSEYLKFISNQKTPTKSDLDRYEKLLSSVQENLAKEELRELKSLSQSIKNRVQYQ